MRNIDYNAFRYQRHCTSSSSSSASQAQKQDIIDKYPEAQFNEFKQRKILFDNTMRLRRIHDPIPVLPYEPESPRKWSTRKRSVPQARLSLRKFCPLWNISRFTMTTHFLSNTTHHYQLSSFRPLSSSVHPVCADNAGRHR